MHFSDRHHMPLRTSAETDRALVRYMNKCYMSGEMAWKGEKLMAGLSAKAPEFSKFGDMRVPRAWRCLKGWRRLSPGRSRRPLPWVAWCGIAR